MNWGFQFIFIKSKLGHICLTNMPQSLNNIVLGMLQK